MAGQHLLYNVLLFNILRVTPFPYLSLLGRIRTTSPISALEFMELMSFTRNK
jgi:hypothetical protein